MLEPSGSGYQPGVAMKPIMEGLVSWDRGNGAGQGETGGLRALATRGPGGVRVAPVRTPPIGVSDRVQRLNLLGLRHTSAMDRQTEFVLRSMEERDIRFVRLWFTDVLGSLKSVAIAPAEVEGAIAEGVGFDGSAIEGFARVYESDMVVHPDPSTFQVLPWRQTERGTARMLCDIQLPDGTPSFADPRHVLKQIGRAHV